MEGVLLTQVNTPIIGQIAWLLGKLMDGIFNAMNSLFGIENIGICIIIFTIIIYTLLLPLTIKQQKFSKMSAVMNPELQAITKKYRNKRDQASQMKMQEETQLLYEKYGTSPVGGCGGMLIQFPILLGLWQVIRNIPAYVGGVKEAYMPLVEGIMNEPGYQKIMEKIGEASPILVNPDQFSYKEANTLIDVLYKFQSSTWETLSSKFPDLNSLIDTTRESISHFNSFLGINIAETPMSMLKQGIADGAIIVIILALLIPVLSGLTQWISVKMTPQPSPDEENPAASTVKTMTVIMPLFSVWMCFTFQAGLGIYWIASAVVRIFQQFVINRYLATKSVEEMIEKNREKMAKKREKMGVSAKEINAMAHKNVKNIKEPQSSVSKKEKEAQYEKAVQANKNAKPGSLASKANMVRNFNESNKTK